MSRRDLSNSDASSHAASELEYVIKTENKNPEIKKVSVDEAISDERVFKASSDRNITRVLFISQNTELLNPTTQSLDGYINVSDLFDEVHILILRPGIATKNPTLRVADNVWIYTATANFWWQTPTAGIKMVQDQLEFASGFRPDLIVALDPFESAIAAYKLGDKYNRPIQLHVLEDYTDSSFKKKERRNLWRRYIPRFVVPKFNSVRTINGYIKDIFLNRFYISDIDVLPRYQKYTSLLATEKTANLKSIYKPYDFFILFIGDFDYDSTLLQALDATRYVLKNPRVGMIILGQGVLKDEIEKRSRVLGIEKQVIFEGRKVDKSAYIKSADIVLITDADNESEELAIKSAAIGAPIVMSLTDKRRGVFEDGKSAFICHSKNTQSFMDRIDNLLENKSVRDKFRVESKKVVQTNFFGDTDEYSKVYRDTIEQAFFVEVENSSE